MSVSQEMQKRVQRQLREVEAREGVSVLYACESGSRAWGFASPDSDYDVRFIYARPLNWYLSILNRRDVLEYPIDEELDLVGWDIRKALQLLRKSNPPLLEWCNSPIVYQELEAFAAFKSLVPEYYSPRACMYHYRNMAWRNYKEYILDKEEVKLKKYLYVFRPLLACRWIAEKEEVVPMQFDVLRNHVLTEKPVRRALDALLKAKMQKSELALGKAVPEFSEFFRSEFEYLEKVLVPPTKNPDPELLDNVFRRLVATNS